MSQINFIQEIGGTAAAASKAIVLPGNPQQNNTLLVGIIADLGSGDSVSTPSGFVRDSIALWASNAKLVALYRKISVGASDVNIIGACTSAGNIIVFAAEYSGILIPASSFDIQAVSNNNAGSTTLNPGPLGPFANYEELVVAIAGINSTITNQAIDSGFTIVDKLNQAHTGIYAHKIVDAKTAVNPQMSWTTSRSNCGLIASYKSLPAMPNNYQFPDGIGLSNSEKIR